MGRAGDGGGPGRGLWDWMVRCVERSLNFALGLGVLAEVGPVVVWGRWRDWVNLWVLVRDEGGEGWELGWGWG